MTLRQLQSRVEAPAVVQHDRDWAAAEQHLRIEFTAEYRQTVDTFGRGYLEPGVVLWDPRSERFDQDVAIELEAMADPELRHAEYGLPYPPYPGPGRRLLPVAADGSGAYVMAVIDDGVQVAEYWECDLDGDTYTALRDTFAGSLLDLADDPSPDRSSWRFGTRFHPL